MPRNEGPHSKASDEGHTFEPTVVFEHDRAVRDDDSDGVVVPERIGRYRVERLLGRGGFGLVYLAHDDQLSRPVAVKVPHSRLILRPEDANAYLAEARTVASLDHPHIVPVFDVGSTEKVSLFRRLEVH